MNFIFRQTQLYKFLNYCNEVNLEKSLYILIMILKRAKNTLKI